MKTKKREKLRKEACDAFREVTKKLNVTAIDKAFFCLGYTCATKKRKKNEQQHK